MDSFYFNKIAGAVLSCLLLLVGLRTFVDIFYPKGEAQSAQTIVVTTNPVPSAAPEANAPQQQAQQDPPADVVLASANADAGQNGAKQCGTCHNWTKGSGTKVGPSLYGVVGRDIGKHPGFSYSPAMQQHGGKWTPEDLYTYLRNPKEAIPGNKMAFAGVKNPQERANIIAFLDKQSDNPEPLPHK
jgi:cytochrome c